MDKYTIAKLKPDEYITASTLNPVPLRNSWIAHYGLLITKDGNKIPIKTPFTVDDNCEIEVKYKENGVGKVKYLSSTPKRKYYMFLKWYIVILEILSILFMIYEINFLGNYATEGSRSSNLLLTLLITWLTINIVTLRNTKSITKWIITIFSYLLLVISTINFIIYLIALISS